MGEKKPEELELKYIIDKTMPGIRESILNTLLANGYAIVKIKQKENDDEYYDTKDFSLLSRGGSLRIRKLTQDGEIKYKEKDTSGQNKIIYRLEDSDYDRKEIISEDDVIYVNFYFGIRAFELFVLKILF